jgi:hypothetical protein
MKLRNKKINLNPRKEISRKEKISKSDSIIDNPSLMKK